MSDTRVPWRPATKPTYQVPSMARIDQVRATNGLSVISTFSGCGGSCLGFEMAGYRIAAASEFIPEARDTYRNNHPNVPLDGRDIREVHPAELLDLAGLNPGELDVLEGSPPCAAFSTAGARSRKWGKESNYSSTKQRSDDLFFEYARLLEGLRPRAFVAENVSGLVKGAAKGYFKEILARLKDCGYQVEAALLDAQWLGVPQQRSRLIFCGVRDDVDARPAFPEPLPYRYTLRDVLGRPGDVAIARGSAAGGRSASFEDPAPTIAAHGVSNSYSYQAGIPAADGDPTADPETGHDLGVSDYVGAAPRVVHDTGGQESFSMGDVTDRPWPTILVGPNALNSRHYQVTGDLDTEVDPETGYRISLADTAIGPEWDKLGPGEVSEKYLSLIRGDPDRPSFTVTSAAGGRGTAGVTHPTQRRKFTLVELRRVCGFPDDFVLTGTYQQRWERLGRAVPPPMAYAQARAMREGVFGLSCEDAYS